MYLSMRLVELLIEELQRRGIETRGLRAFGKARSDNETGLPLEQLDHFVRCVLQLSEDPGLQASMQLHASSYALQVLGYVVVSSSTLQDALASFLDHDPEAEPIVSDTVTKLFRTATRNEGLAERVRTLLLGDAFAFDPDTLSWRLGVSRRALRRKLNQEGVNLTALVNEARCQRACEALRGPEANIKEISNRLGYSEPSAFHRAFKRWTGKSPRRYVLGLKLRSAELQQGPLPRAELDQRRGRPLKRASSYLAKDGTDRTGSVVTPAKAGRA